MIKLYGINLTQLPDKLAMTDLIRDQFYQAWKKRYRNIRDEHIMRSSLGGLFLLQEMGLDGTLVYGPKGRPYFKDSDIDFNISHTDLQTFCAMEKTPSSSVTCPPVGHEQPFGGVCRVGLDAEDLSHVRHIRICPLAQRWFTPSELELFLSKPDDESFLRIWTRKEALIKFTGEGLQKMRKADTTKAAEEYGVRFFEYCMGNTLITLCAHETAEVPDEVYMVPVSEVFL